MGRFMKKTQEKENDNSVDGIVRIGSFFWAIMLSAAVFFGTLWTNQALVNSKMEYVNSEVKKLYEHDEEMNQKIEKISSDQRALLLDISTRLRELEIKITELQVKLTYMVGKAEQNNSNTK